MTVPPFPTQPSTVSEGETFVSPAMPLKKALARSQRRAKQRAFLLVAPLLLFVLVTFVVPIAQMLSQAVRDDGFFRHVDPVSSVSTPIMQNTIAWLEEHPDQTSPAEEAFVALQQDLLELRTLRAAGQVGNRINYELPGTRSLFTRAARRAPNMEAPYTSAFLALDEQWADPALWATMRYASQPVTPNFLLAAIDLRRSANGGIEQVSEDQRIYRDLFIRTLIFSAVITAFCLFFGYPVAHLLAHLPPGRANLLMICVLLPFWTSLLVRTTSWIILLQSQGVFNDALVATGLVGDENRIQLMYNQAGTIISMTHILMPFAILPLFSVMKSIDGSYVRAARSLGASSWTAFFRVYLPQTMPGIAAGALLVFILAIGYYITPALVGGADGQLISNLIAFHMQKSLNWSLAAALASLLLVGVVALYWLYDQLVGINNLKLG